MGITFYLLLYRLYLPCCLIGLMFLGLKVDHVPHGPNGAYGGWRKIPYALLHILKSRKVEYNMLALKLSWWFLMIDSIQGNDESLILISTQISFWASSSSTLVAALLPPRLCLVRYRRCCHQYHLCRCFWWDIAVIVVMFFKLYRQCLQYRQCR